MANTRLETLVKKKRFSKGKPYWYFSRMDRSGSEKLEASQKYRSYSGMWKRIKRIQESERVNVMNEKEWLDRHK